MNTLLDEEFLTTCYTDRFALRQCYSPIPHFQRQDSRQMGATDSHAKKKRTQNAAIRKKEGRRMRHSKNRKPGFPPNGSTTARGSYGAAARCLLSRRRTPAHLAGVPDHN